ncbi:hypothetical protein EYC80_001269 [Monilinia laxa]|uniref:non-specific serine/threonine protein kinase n=1 Tax=Monilinia laxa TaxID=61186 RepID=A0A5N6K8W1_MONLA|nr:hypothetical protein EYC80_001269 [Monilinia laxa]
MAPRPRSSRRPSLARRSQARHFSVYAGVIRRPTQVLSLKERNSIPAEESLAKIGNNYEAKTSSTTIASTFRGISLSKTRSKASTWASVESASIPGPIIEGSSKPTRAEKAARKKALKKARKENSNVDSNFIYLPKGLNSKIKERDPLRAKLGRLFGSRRKRKTTHQLLDRTQPVSTPKLGYRTDRHEPAPPRCAPPIAPARVLGETIEENKTGSSLGRNFQAYWVATEKERAEHVKEVQLQYDLRKATDMKLRLEGREQINDPLIGRAPPIKSARFDTVVSSSTSEASPREFVSAEQAQAHLGDRLQLHGNIQTLKEYLVGTTPFTSEGILLSKKLHSISLKKPSQRLPVSVTESVESFIVPSTDYDDSNSQKLDPFIHEDFSREHLKISERSDLQPENSLKKPSLAEGEEYAPESNQNQQGKLTTFVNESSDNILEIYHGRPKGLRDLTSMRINSDKLMIGGVRLLSQASLEKSATYDNFTKILLSSNTPAPEIPKKSRLRQLSQQNPNSSLQLVKDNLTLTTINPITKKEVESYLSELISLIEVHEERMGFLRRNKQGHRLKHGELQDPGAPVHGKPHKLKARLSRFFSGEKEVVVDQLQEVDVQQESEEEEDVPDNGASDLDSNDSHLTHPQTHVTEFREQRLSFTSATSTRDQAPAPQGQGGYTSDVGPGDDCREGDGQQRPFLSKLSPQQRWYYNYNYVPPTTEAQALESKEAREERYLKAEKDAVLANEAVCAAYRAVLEEFDNLDGAADFSASRSGGGIERDSTSDRANNKSHVTFGALSHEERGLRTSPAFTAATNSSTFRQKSQTSFGYKSQTSSLQVPKVTEAQNTGDASRLLSSQFTAPQRSEPNPFSQRASSYTNSSSKQHYKEDSSKWINSDTLLAGESDKEGVYRAYYQSSGSDQVPNNKAAINQKVESNQFSTSEVQVTAQLERTKALRGESKALQDSKIVEAPKPHPLLTAEEEKARFQRGRFPRGSDPNSVRTARLKYSFLSIRHPRTDAEEKDFVALCATHHPDGTLRRQPVTEEIVTSEPDIDRRVPWALLHRGPDPNPERTAYVRQLVQSPEDKLKEDEARKAAAQRLVSTGTAVNPVRKSLTPAAVKPARQLRTLTTVPARELPEPSALSPLEVNRLRVTRARQHTRELQSNRNISTGSPVPRGAHTFGYDSLLSAPHRNFTTPANQVSYRSQLPQPGSSPRDLQSSSPLSQGNRAQGFSSGLPTPQGWSQNNSLTRQEPFVASRLRQPSHSNLQASSPPPRSSALPVSAKQESTSISRLPLPGISITPVSPTLQPSQLSFLGVSLVASGAHFAEMDKLQVRNTEPLSVKAKAIEDARQMQASVIEAATKAGKEPPKYALVELIGKGSFGRVYKGKDMVSAAIVAVKIIDIEESDTINPKNANSYAEFLKEITALKTLSENKARNINHVIEALPVGQAMWMITEYCGGGSVATLMKPTAPGGLQEKWIIPILREVAEAIKWVHEAGIIHRDIKCANVLITEEGAVQLCDFGVAGTMETKVDKRSTVIGTPHWMAPELFDSVPSYGKEVDIWAFGCMVYEIATGLPPNAMSRLPFDRLGSLIKQNAPRLEGGDYSDDLRDLVAFCLEEFPSERPSIDRVQNHRYLFNTSAKYPMSSLSHLVRAFKVWEDHGGSRKSLFMLGGAQAPSELSSTALSDDEWNFSTTAAFEQDVRRKSTAQDVYDVYGSGVEFDAGFPQETARPPPRKGRRPPPEALAPLRGPLEKIFDPNTLSNYEDNSRNHYGRPFQPPASELTPVPSRSDLPLRDDTAQTDIRDTMIDLGGHDVETGISVFPDLDTIKAGRRAREEPDEDYMTTLPDFSRPALSDPAEINPNRRTQDWKFPAMVPPASADPEVSRFPSNYEVPKPVTTPGVGGRPALVHHPTEPLGEFGGGLPPAEIHTGMARLSVRESLIDLDMNSDAISILSDSGQPPLTSSSANPFELEHHTSSYQPTTHVREPSIYTTSHVREPSIYVTEEMGSFSASATPPRPESTSRPLRPDRPPRLCTSNALGDIADISDYSDSAAESTLGYNTDTNDTDSDYATASMQLHPQSAIFRDSNAGYTMAHFPNLPPAPLVRALTGEASHEEMAFEMSRMLTGLTGQLEAFRDVYGSEDLARRSNQRRERRDNGENGV